MVGFGGLKGIRGQWGRGCLGGRREGALLPMWQPCLGQVLTQTIPDRWNRSYFQSPPDKELLRDFYYELKKFLKREREDSNTFSNTKETFQSWGPNSVIDSSFFANNLRNSRFSFFLLIFSFFFFFTIEVLNRLHQCCHIPCVCIFKCFCSHKEYMAILVRFPIQAAFLLPSVRSHTMFLRIIPWFVHPCISCQLALKAFGICALGGQELMWLKLSTHISGRGISLRPSVVYVEIGQPSGMCCTIGKVLVLS